METINHKGSDVETRQTEIKSVDALSVLRQVLLSTTEERTERFAQQLEQLTPFWHMPVAQKDSPSELAKMLGLFGPENEPNEGLDALAMLEGAGSWPACLKALRDALDLLQPQRFGLQEVQFSLTLAAPGALDQVGGYTGFGGRPGTVLLLVWPSEFNIPRLPAVVAHETHHNARFLYEPWTLHTTVGQYIVAEGLAEAFAAAQYGEEFIGPWAKGLSSTALEELKPIYREVIEHSGDIRGYMFGDWAAERFGYAKRGVPEFAGYAFGYALVCSYLERTRTSILEATYTPWQEIVEGADYL